MVCFSLVRKLSAIYILNVVLVVGVILMDTSPPNKKLKSAVDDPDTKRRQVDNHVQAFLKAVLDHAHEYSLQKKENEIKQIVTHDVSTQTDDVEDDIYVPMESMSCCAETSNSIRAPNREMYSDEALQFISEQEIYSHQLRSELSDLSEEKLHYYTQQFDVNQAETVTSVQPSSAEIKLAMTQWVKKYEDWFLENFGMDIHTALKAVDPPVVTNPNTHSVETENFNNASAQSSCVLSHPPVSYIVPEGSLCIPNSQFSPYFSLVPSSYVLPTTTSPMVINGLGGSYLNPNEYQNMLNTNNALFSNSLNVNNSVHFPAFINNLVHNTIENIPPSVQTLPNEPREPSFTELSNQQQTSAMLAALTMPLLNEQQNQDQWGPQLKYGTYGRLPTTEETLSFKKQEFQSTMNNSPDIVEKKASSQIDCKMPPPPPTFILLRRQVMICALQTVIKERARDLFLREKESSSGISIDYTEELNSVVESCIGVKPEYLFTQVNKLPLNERTFYLQKEVNHEIKQVSDAPISDGINKTYDTQHFFVCDLLIGDVLISESLSTFKLRAKMSAARQAFEILSYPCFLVGSIRKWDDLCYLVLCLSHKAELVPQLPPFLCDPFEIPKDTEPLDEESAVIPNPKPIDDLWIYLANLPKESLDDPCNDIQILTQSAAFNQISITFEIKVRTDNGLFSCSALVDNQVAVSVEADSVPSSRELATRKLIEWLQSNQPIVGLSHPVEDESHLGEFLSDWGMPDYILVSNLMWGKEEINLAIPLEHLEAHCDLTEFASNISGIDEPFSSPEVLDQYLEAYAESAIVTPLRISSTIVNPKLWPMVRASARRWGLLTLINNDTACNGHDLNVDPSSSSLIILIVCKQIPMPRIKRSLYDEEKYGCFSLLHKGNLSSESIKRLSLADPITLGTVDQITDHVGIFDPDRTFYSQSNHDNSDTYESYADEPISQLARRLWASSSAIRVKSESSDGDVTKFTNDDCMFLSVELNNPSNAIEIIDDLPKTLIPGIDF